MRSMRLSPISLTSTVQQPPEQEGATPAVDAEAWQLTDGRLVTTESPDGTTSATWSSVG